MSIQTAYVRGDSKAAINAKIEAGQTVMATIYTMLDRRIVKIQDLQHGDVIKVFSQIIDGNPYAKAYGNWDAKRGRIK